MWFILPTISKAYSGNNMSVLNRDGIEIYYEVYGQGPPLLLTHGYSATSKMWNPNIEALSENHTVITWDMRGHGQSDSPKDNLAYSETLTTADMAALLFHLGHESAIVGGLSLGGYMSLAFYADYPEMVEALLIIDTGPGFKQDAARDAWNRMAIARAEVIERDEKKALESRSPEQTMATHKDLQGLAFAARNMLTQYTSRVIKSLPQIEVPSIVVVGGDDEPFLIASDYMALKIPHATKVVIPQAGHAANIDQAELFNKAILGFLTTHNL
jgi:pimeloyl-ACP methyl ester carboxylesterase